MNEKDPSSGFRCMHSVYQFTSAVPNRNRINNEFPPNVIHVNRIENKKGQSKKSLYGNSIYRLHDRHHANGMHNGIVHAPSSVLHKPKLGMHLS